MAMLDKDAYLGKQLYAERKRKEDWDNQIALASEGKKALTEEQMEVLETITSRRHNLHSEDARSIFNDQSEDSDDYTYFIGSFYDGNEFNVNKDLQRVGLPKIEHLQTIADNIVIEMDFDMEAEEKGLDKYDNEEEWQELYEQYITVLSSQLEEIDDEIQKFLRQIDKEYGTEYCPTGFARL